MIYDVLIWKHFYTWKFVNMRRRLLERLHVPHDRRDKLCTLERSDALGPLVLEHNYTEQPKTRISPGK